MQATVRPTAELARDLSAFYGHLLKTADLFRTVGELELSVTQFKMLVLLHGRREELALKDLAEEMALSLPAASRAVDGLHQRDYVSRREDEQDRRLKRVRIAPPGDEVMERVEAVRIATIQRFLDTLSEAERKRLAGALAPVLARVDTTDKS